jgi:hypothetical protein
MRVVDAGVMPLTIGASFQQTVCAIAEKVCVRNRHTAPVHRLLSFTFRHRIRSWRISSSRDAEADVGVGPTMNGFHYLPFSRVP